MSEQYLQGKTAIITGGASGMGRAMAMAMASAGANIAIGSLLSKHQESTATGELVFLPGEKELNDTKTDIEALGVQCIALDLDVCSSESVQQFYDAAIEVFGQVDILANAAGITAEQTICNHPDALWDKVVDVNLNGPYRTAKLCLPGMIERKWGRIINIASTAASVGAKTSAAYCASKAGVLGLSRCIALEGAPHGVTCNTISPGWVETSFGKDWMTHIAEEAEGRSGEEYIAETKASNPQQRMIQPTEIGALAAYLCREEAIGITMQDLTLSAGSLW